MSDDQTKTPPPVVPTAGAANTPPPPPSDVPPVPPSPAPASAPQPQPAPQPEDKPTPEELAEAEAKAKALLGQTGGQSTAPTKIGGRVKKVILGALAFLLLGGGLVVGVGQVQHQLLLQSLAKSACGPGDVKIDGKTQMTCKEVGGEWKWKEQKVNEETYKKLKQQANQAERKGEGDGTVHFQGNEQQLENLLVTGNANQGSSAADCGAAGLPYCSGCGGFCGNWSTGCNTLSLQKCGEYKTGIVAVDKSQAQCTGEFETWCSSCNACFPVKSDTCDTSDGLCSAIGGGNNTSTYYCEGTFSEIQGGCSDMAALPPGVHYDPATGQIVGSFCGTIQVDIPGKGFVTKTDASGCKKPLKKVSEKPEVPTPPISGPVCSGLSKSPASPTAGSEVTLTCSAAGSPINHYEFQYSLNGGAFTALTAASSGSNQAKFNVTQAGDYVARCRVCKTTDSSQCTAYQTL